MSLIIARLVQWLASKLLVIALIWVMVIGAVALYLVGKSYLEELPERKAQLTTQLEAQQRELQLLDDRLANLEGEFASLAQQAKGELDAATQELREQIRAVNQLRNRYDKLSSWWRKLEANWNPEAAAELKRVEEKLQAAEERRQRLQALWDKAEEAQREIASRLRSNEQALVEQRQQTREDIARTRDKIAVVDAEITERDSQVAVITGWLSEALDVALWALIITTAVFLFGPILWKSFLYFLWAPLLERSRPIRLTMEPGGTARVTESRVSQPVELEPGDEIIIKPAFLQSGQEGLRKKTKFIFDLRFPITSLACGLIEMTRISHGESSATSTDGENAPPAKPPTGKRRVTLSSQQEAEVELAVVDVPEGGSMVCRPSFLVGVFNPGGERMQVRSHWRIFSMHAWLTLQFRYFEFIGPGKLILWGHRGVRAEQLAGDEPAVTQNLDEPEAPPETEALTPRAIAELPRMRTNQDSTIGFQPQLAYTSVRAETFWAYFRGNNPLFDDLFAGQGLFLCQEISKASDAAQARKFWQTLWNSITKVFGV